jgi:glycine cleavage system H protein
MKIQPNLKYTTTDEWLLIEGKVATLGVSDYAQNQLSDIVFVEVSAAEGETLKKNSTVATIESVKAAADVNTPVTGKVIKVNEALANTPETVNSDPYGAAWMLKMELTSPAEVDALMDAKAYEKFCADRSH